MTRAEDKLRENHTFMDYEQWKAVLDDSGLVLKLVYPREGSLMEVFGQKLYVAGRRK